LVHSIGGAVVEISDANVRDLSQLCHEFEFTKTVGDWQAEHPLTDAWVRPELELVQAALDERLESQDHTMFMLDQALYRGREAEMGDAQRQRRRGRRLRGTLARRRRRRSSDSLTAATMGP
jgi:hypothetical protein